jgi:ABC-type multidrug transport system ATPase subunit
MCALVLDDDRTHLPELTVRETMAFAARVNVPRKPAQTDAEYEAALAELVDRVVESLGLSDQADIVVGGTCVVCLIASLLLNVRERAGKGRI